MTPRPSASTSPHHWDWRHELTRLDAEIDAVERQGSWNWQAELAELEAKLEQLAHKHGLQPISA